MAVARPLSTLNGWTAERLDDLAKDVADIRTTLDEMRSQELVDLKGELKAARAQIREAKAGPRAALTAYLAPLLAGLVPTIIILIHG